MLMALNAKVDAKPFRCCTREVEVLLESTGPLVLVELTGGASAGQQANRAYTREELLGLG
jgi:hypothetical protein